MSAVFSKKSLSVSKCVLVGLLVLGLLAGCATVKKKEVLGELVWPPPPEVPRIKWVKEISRSTDVGKKETSTSDKLIESLLGIKQRDGKMLAKPYGVYSDGDGRVYVADSAIGKVVVFDSKAKEILVFGKKGPGQLAKAMGVVSGKDGRVYVSDSYMQKVVIYDAKGKFLNTIGGKDELVNPVGIALDEKRGRIYVVDSHGHHIVAFDPEGKVLFSIGKKNAPMKLVSGASDHAWNRGFKKGEFRFPSNIAVDKEGNLYVADTLNYRVQIFNPEGEYLSTVGGIGDGFGQFSRPKGIAVDSQGNIYVSDASFSNVQIFDASGKLLLFFGNVGTGRGEFYLPAGISIDASDRIYVADQYNQRIQVFQFLKQAESEPEKLDKAVNKKEKTVNNKKGGKKR